MKKYVTIENFLPALPFAFIVVAVLATYGVFDGPPSGKVYGKRTEPPTKHCTYYDSGRIQKIPVDAKYFIYVYLNDNAATDTWEVPKYVYDNAEIGEIWEKP
jgi:nitrous oxide reductase accessory protein NosL